MKKIYFYNGDLPTSQQFETELGKTWKGLERAIEYAVGEAQSDFQTHVKYRWFELLKELNLTYADALNIVTIISAAESRIEDFISENVGATDFGPDEDQVQDLFSEMLHDLFGVKIENEDDLDCEDCSGNGHWEKGLAGRRMPCETCNGTGQLTPEQLEEKYPNVEARHAHSFTTSHPDRYCFRTRGHCEILHSTFEPVIA